MRRPETSVAGAEDVGVADVEALEADRGATPLSPLIPAVRAMADQLVRPGERLPLVVGGSAHNQRYLRTKRDKLGHIFDESD